MNLRIFCLILILPQIALAQNSERILGGGYSSLQEPIVFLNSPNGSCSGAVIGNKSILTAAHCLSNFSGTPLLAGIGGKYFEVKKGYVGPNDLALLVTKKKIPGRRYKVIKNSLPRPGLVLTVFGFGAPESGILKYTYMQVAGYESGDAFIASSLDGSTTCSGDSGGPAVYNYRGRLVVLGIVSRGQSSCAVGSTTVFGATGSTRGYNWIANKLKSIDK